jgi:hypothetical protein
MVQVSRWPLLRVESASGSYHRMRCRRRSRTPASLCATRYRLLEDIPLRAIRTVCVLVCRFVPPPAHAVAPAKAEFGSRPHFSRTRSVVGAKANNMPLCLDSMHRKCYKRQFFDYFEESVFFRRCHDLRFEQKAIGRTSQRKELLLTVGAPGHTN